MEKKVVEEELNFAKKEHYKLTMMPGAFAVKLRTCIIFQFIRFVIINVKMIIVVGKSH
jgi:hypothetical protein